ncbi:DUF3857 domain-containing protein [Catenovulum sediminis]|uniref:DUF3857 domain-containing protein n=1 Tax=Catenovulum sediminis TaxID=1740262 RepID=A0ABV1RIQ8_9ALTE
MKPTSRAVSWAFLVFSLFHLPLWALSNAQDVEFKIEKAPNWVTPKQLEQKLSLAKLRKPAHYHLVDVQKHVASQSQYRRYIYSVSDPSGISDYSDISIRFNPAFEKLTIHTINIVRDGKIVSRVEKSDIKIINAEDDRSNNIYSGEMTAVTLLKGVQLGDTIDYAYSLAGQNPVFSGNFASFEWLGWRTQVDQINVEVISPKSRNIHYQVYGTAQTVSVTQQEDNLLYRLNISNSQKVFEEDNVPSWHKTYPYVQFSEYANWQQVATWASALFTVNSQPSEQYLNLIKELKKQPQKQAIEKAINYVQDEIRYLGLELAENSHKPHTPNEVIANKYGDCKDKSLLLVELLKELGVKANVALVSSYKSKMLNTYLPAHNVFNHAIVKLEYNDNKYWIDPTISLQGFKLENKYQPNYSYALLIEHNSTNNDSVQLVDATPSQPLKGTVNIKETVKAIDYVSPVEWIIVSHFTGVEAEDMRYKVNNSGLDSIQKQYLNYYAKTFPKISKLSALKASDDIKNNHYTLTEHYLVPDFWTIHQTASEFALNADYTENFIYQPDTIIRSQPLYIPPRVQVEHRVTFILPEDIDFSSSVTEDVLEDKHVRFVSNLSYDRRHLTYSNQLHSKTDHVNPEDVADYLSLLKKIEDHKTYYGEITNVTQESSMLAMQKLASRLNKMRAKNSLPTQLYEGR